jgi:hypothetical protein
MKKLKTFSNFISEANFADQLKASGAPKEVKDMLKSAFEDPKFKSAMFDMVSNLSPDQIEKIKKELKQLDVTSESNPDEVAAKVQSEVKESEEIFENSEAGAKQVGKVLHEIGAANIAAWGGVPAAIVIGAAVGMPLGFAISWGATALLMGLAKMLGVK